MIHPLIVNENYVKYCDYSSERLLSGILERKQVPKTNPPQYYHIFPIRYQYAYEDDFIIEGCPMDCVAGIQTKVKNNDTQYSLNCKINNDPFLDAMDGIYKDLAQLIVLHKDELPRFAVNTEIFKRPIYRPPSSVIKEGKMALKVQKGFLNQTIFTDVQGTMIPWHELSNTYMRFIPYLNIKHIHIGDRISLKLTLLKATVLYFGPLIKQSRAVVPRNTKYQLTYTDLLKTPYISHENYSTELLIALPPESRGDGSYYKIPLYYRPNELIDDLLIEGPEIISKHISEDQKGQIHQGSICRRCFYMDLFKIFIKDLFTY